MIYECDNGHKAEIDFGEETIAKCPTCGVSIHKFRAKNIIEGQAPESLTPKSETPSAFGAWFEENWKGLAFWAVTLTVIGYAGNMAYEMYFPKTAQADVSAITTQATPPQEAQAPLATEPVDINAIAVKDFQAAASTGNNIKITFNLVNTNASNPYPDLVITWIGGQTKPITVPQSGYPHPQTAFTAPLPVEFDIARPADATGVKVSVQYPQ